MVLELHRCTEADIPEFVRIQIAAFVSHQRVTTFSDLAKEASRVLEAV